GKTSGILKPVQTELRPAGWKATLEFGHFLPNSVVGANPQGWQRVTDGRSGQRGNDHRYTASDDRAPRRWGQIPGDKCNSGQKGANAILWGNANLGRLGSDESGAFVPAAGKAWKSVASALGGPTGSGDAPGTRRRGRLRYEWNAREFAAEVSGAALAKLRVMQQDMVE